jgi:hypothetical protein
MPAETNSPTLSFRFWKAIVSWTRSSTVNVVHVTFEDRRLMQQQQRSGPLAIT